MNTKTKSNSNETCETIKLGIDAHAKWYYVARQLDGTTPQPVQKMSLPGLLRFVAKQKGLCREVHTCYEAGAFGYHLHRRLEAMGVRNLVVQPQDWDERGKGVKTDRIDALNTALKTARKPAEIVNTDQGAQFTAEPFVERVLGAGTAMSMDGRGRWLDNRFIERLWRSYKYVDVYLRAYESPAELECGTASWFAHYNECRPHQALGYRTPCDVYRGG